MGGGEFLRRVEEEAEELRKLIDERRFFAIFCHNDADGLSSGALASVMFLRARARFMIRSVQGIEEVFEAGVQLPEEAIIVLTDMGSGYLSELAEKFRERVLVILDHHGPEGETPEGWIHVNPHLDRIDGAREISGAGVVYLVAKNLDPENISHSPVAIVGALGDLQDKSEERELKGLNRMIVDDAVRAGLLQVSEDLLFYGRSHRPLHLSLASTTSPYIPGISGSEAHAVSFLNSIGIKVKEDDRWRVLAELSEEEKKTIFNGLMRHLVSLNLSPSIAKELMGKVYELTREEEWTPLRDAREFASLLNACGKTGNEWAGIAVAMGSRGDALIEAQRILEEYRRRLAGVMDYMVRRENWQELRHIIAIDGGSVVDERMVSSAASLLSSSNLLPEDKPLVALAVSGEKVKVSARASRKLVEEGLDLGAVLGRAAESVGGRGGGHDIAAGAEIPLAKKTMFLAEVDRLVGEALGGSGQS